jgi:hypothetical protein
MKRYDKDGNEVKKPERIDYQNDFEWWEYIDSWEKDNTTPQQMAERIKDLTIMNTNLIELNDNKDVEVRESQQENQRLREGIEETKNYLFGSIEETKVFLNGDRGELTKSDIYQTKSFTRGKQIGLIMAYEKLELQTKQNKEG